MQEVLNVLNTYCVLAHRDDKTPLGHKEFVKVTNLVCGDCHSRQGGQRGYEKITDSSRSSSFLKKRD